MLGYLIILNIIFVLTHLTLLFQYFIPSQERAIIYFTIGEILKMILLYNFLLIFEMFYRNKQYSRRQMITTFLIFTIIGNLISRPELDIYTKFEGFVIDLKFFSITKILEIIFTTFVTIFLSYILIKSRKTRWNLRQKKAIIWLFLGSLLGVLISILADLFLEISAFNSINDPLISQTT